MEEDETKQCYSRMPKDSPTHCSIWNKNLPSYQLEDLEGKGQGYDIGGK